MSTGARRDAPIGQIARRSVPLVLGDAASRGAAVVASVYLARTLGVAGFGLLAFAQALAMYPLLVADWGLGTFGTRQIARSPGSWRGLAARLTVLRGALAVCCSAASCICIWVSPWDSVTKWVVGVSVLSIIPQLLIPDWVLRGREHMWAVGALATAQAALILGGVLWFIRHPADVGTVPVVRFMAAAVVALVAQLSLWTSSARSAPVDWTRVRPRRSDLIQLLLTGTVLLLADLSVLAYNNVDVVLLKILRDDHAAGLYSGAYRLIQVPMFSFYAVTTAALPALARQSSEGWRAVDNTVRPIVLASAALGTMVAMGVAFFGDGIIRLVYGAQFHAAATPLAILAFAIPLDLVTAIKGTSYIARGFERPALLCVAGSAVFNVLANLLLIPLAGLAGAASATLASYAVLLVAYVVLLDRRGRHEPRLSQAAL